MSKYKAPNLTLSSLLMLPVASLESAQKLVISVGDLDDMEELAEFVEQFDDSLTDFRYAEDGYGYPRNIESILYFDSSRTACVVFEYTGDEIPYGEDPDYQRDLDMEWR